MKISGPFYTAAYLDQLEQRRRQLSGTTMNNWLAVIIQHENIWLLESTIDQLDASIP